MSKQIDETLSINVINLHVQFQQKFTLNRSIKWQM
jgi:hypothetical protein